MHVTTPWKAPLLVHIQLHIREIGLMPDLRPLEFYLWRHMKQIVYAKVGTITGLPTRNNCRNSDTTVAFTMLKSMYRTKVCYTFCKYN